MKRKMTYFKFVILLLLIGSTCFAQTEGQLLVQVTTSKTGGEYAPKNVVAIWVENSSGNFVKTLLDYGEKRKTHLNIWENATTKSGSPFNVTDAITGATQSNHGTRMCIWNGIDYLGNATVDGTYNLCMELTDKNNTGNFSTFEFTKGGDSIRLNPSDVPSFSSIQITWVPTQKLTIGEIQNDDGYNVYPSPNNGELIIKGKEIQMIKIFSLDGKLVYQGTETIIKFHEQPTGQYLVQIKTPNDTILKRILKE